jgi:hypothetical protein
MCSRRAPLMHGDSAASVRTQHVRNGTSCARARLVSARLRRPRAERNHRPVAGRQRRVKFRWRGSRARHVGRVADRFVPRGTGHRPRHATLLDSTTRCRSSRRVHHAGGDIRNGTGHDVESGFARVREASRNGDRRRASVYKRNSGAHHACRKGYRDCTTFRTGHVTSAFMGTASRETAAVCSALPVRGRGTSARRSAAHRFRE